MSTIDMQVQCARNTQQKNVRPSEKQRLGGQGSSTLIASPHIMKLKRNFMAITPTSASQRASQVSTKCTCRRGQIHTS
eukprot:620395-Amphidinium_carterae.1